MATKTRRGGAYKRPSSTRKLKQRPIGFELPRRESRFEYVRRVPRNNQIVVLNTILNTRKSRKPRIQINLTKPLTVRKDTTYQYLKSILLFLKQILKDASRAENINTERYDTLTQMVTEISYALPDIKRDLGLNSNSNNNNNNMNADKFFDDIEELVYIIREYMRKYERALRSGKIRAIERVEAEMELMAVTIDTAIQSAKSQYEPVNNVDDLAKMFNTLQPFKGM